MLIGLIASTEIEIVQIFKKLRISEQFTIKSRSFYKFIIHKNISIIACISGIGKVNAAHFSTLLLERFNPDILYVIGVGGAYPSSGLNIGDIAIAEKEIYGDEGLALKNSFHTLEELDLPLIKNNQSIYFNDFPMYIPDFLKKFKNKGNFVTVSSCTGSVEKALIIERKFDAICENMEGAAISHICTLYDIPVVEIRGISNIIVDRKAESLSKKDILRASLNVQNFFSESVLDHLMNTEIS